MANRGGMAAKAAMEAKRRVPTVVGVPGADDGGGDDADGLPKEEPAYAALPMPFYGNILGPFGVAWHNASVKLLDFTYGNKMSNFVLGVIVLAGILVGIQTYPGMEEDPVVKAIDGCVLVIFICELTMKFFSEGLRPWRMFFGPNWAWNWFDLIIVVMCLPMVPVSGYASALRLARLARLLKLVNKIPQLKLIISGLVGGLRAIMYIMLLLLMVFYFYAILGMTCFMKNDPWHWGHFGYAMETLFRMATMEDWTEIMYINYYGCDKYHAAIYAPRLCVTQAEKLLPYENHCTNMAEAVCLPANASAQRFATILFFVSFIVVSALVLLSMFIGAVTIAMSESIDEISVSARAQKRHDRQEAERKRVEMMVTTSNAQLIQNMSREELLKHKRIRKCLKNAWDGDIADGDFDAADAEHFPKELDNTFKRSYDRLANVAKGIVDSHVFQLAITACIILACLLVGMQVEPSIKANTDLMAFLDAMDYVITIIFTIEVLLKLVACSIHPHHFFYDNWNRFDFLIVASAWYGSKDLVLLRIVRLLRVLKMVKSVPELRMHVEALAKGLDSITYIGMIMFLAFYIMGIVGIIMFSKNDPWHFANIHLAMITLFRIATMEDWTDIMYINQFGCDKYGYDGTAWNGVPARSECVAPQAWGFIAVAYFVGFVLVASLVLLNLFIGVITASMETSKKEMDAEQELQKQVQSLQEEQQLDGGKMSVYREVFMMLDLDTSGALDKDELRMGLKAVDKSPTDEELDFMLELVDTDASGEIDYVEFIQFMVNAEKKDLKSQRRDSMGKNPTKGGGGNDLAAKSKATANKRVAV